MDCWKNSNLAFYDKLESPNINEGDIYINGMKGSSFEALMKSWILDLVDRLQIYSLQWKQILLFKLKKYM